MTKRIDDRLSQSLIGNFKSLLSLKTVVGDFAAEIKMLEAKGKPSIKKVKEINSTRISSINSFLSVPKKRAIFILKLSYSSTLSENSIAAPLVGMPFFSNFHLDSVSEIGSLNALALFVCHRSPADRLSSAT